MKKILLYFFILVNCMCVEAVADERDPFRTVLPEPRTAPQFTQIAVYEPPVDVELHSTGQPQEMFVEPLAVVVEGVFWDIDNPAVIIDGDIYRNKDKLKNHDARILKIDRNDVTVLYRGTTQSLRAVSRLEQGDAARPTPDTRRTGSKRR
jgi:hypothetical protein